MLPMVRFVRVFPPVLLVALVLAAPAPRAGQSTPSASLALPQERHLANVKQLSFGDENAEAYFSFDGRRLSFQSTRGRGCDQIYTMNIDGSDVKLVSNGQG